MEKQFRGLVAALLLELGQSADVSAAEWTDALEDTLWDAYTNRILAGESVSFEYFLAVMAQTISVHRRSAA